MFRRLPTLTACRRTGRTGRATLVAVALSGLLHRSPAEAALSAQTSYQGVITDDAGNLVPDGNYTLTFRLYTVASGGSAVWSETQNNVPVAKGGFSVLLGSVTTLGGLQFDNDYWLGVSVSGGAELAPRVKLASSPYAFHSRRAVELVLPYNTTVNLVSPPVFVTNNGSGPAIIGQTNSNAANAYGLRGFVGSNSPSTSSAGIKGENIAATSNGYGVWGSHNGSGRGVYGYAPFGTGVFGEGASGIGVQGVSSNGTGVLGQTNSTAAGVYAVRGTLGAAVPGNGSAGVRGEGSAGNANTVGMWGYHPGGGTGVFGQSVSGFGVGGATSGTNAAGVHGYSTAATSPGVKAVNTNPTGTALEIQGALKVAGAGHNTDTAAFIHQANSSNTSLMVGAWVSRIDNPLCNGTQDVLLFVTLEGRYDAAGVAPYVNYIPPYWYIGFTGNRTPVDNNFNVLILRTD